MTRPTGDPEGYALAFEEGKRAVAEQASTLKETRDRVGTVVSAAAVVAGLAAALTFNSSRISGLSGWGAVATAGAAIGFAVMAAGAVMIWWPFPGTFTMDAGMIVGSYVEGDPPASLPDPPRALPSSGDPRGVQPRPPRPQTPVVRRNLVGVPRRDRKPHAGSSGCGPVSRPTSSSPPPSAPPAPSRPDPGITEKKGAPPPTRPAN